MKSEILLTSEKGDFFRDRLAVRPYVPRPTA